ncbi:hypothetical protein HKW90_01770 [Pseudomonas aeruginosa]|nr:hypothetical protein [Pseudomonas aeruginosa]
MKWTQIALLLAATAASNAQAERLVILPALSVIKCTPVPSIKTLDKETAYQGGKLVLGGPVTCVVPKGQPVPVGSKFIGHQADGPVSNSYAFQWEVLQLQDGYSVRLNNAEHNQPSTDQRIADELFLTFHEKLAVDQATDLK